MAGLINYNRVNPKPNQVIQSIVKEPELRVMQGMIVDIQLQSNEIMVKDLKTSAGQKFIVNEVLISKLAKGKMVEVSFYQGSKVAQKVTLIKEAK